MAARAEISRHLRNLLPPGTVRQQALVWELLVAPASNVQTRETRADSRDSFGCDGRPARAAGAEAKMKTFPRAGTRAGSRARAGALAISNRARRSRLSIVCTLFCEIQQLLQRYPHRVVELMRQLIAIECSANILENCGHYHLTSGVAPAHLHLPEKT